MNAPSLVRLGMLPGAHALPQGSMRNAGGRAGAIAHRGLPEGTADRPVDSATLQVTEHGGVHPGEERRGLAGCGNSARQAGRSTRGRAPAPQARPAQQRQQRAPARRRAPQNRRAARARGPDRRRARVVAVPGTPELCASIRLAGRPAAARDANPQRAVGPWADDAQRNLRGDRHAVEGRAAKHAQQPSRGLLPGDTDAARPGRMCAALRACRRAGAERRALHAVTNDSARTV